MIRLSIQNFKKHEFVDPVRVDAGMFIINVCDLHHGPWTVAEYPEDALMQDHEIPNTCDRRQMVFEREQKSHTIIP